MLAENELLMNEFNKSFSV